MYKFVVLLLLCSVGFLFVLGVYAILFSEDKLNTYTTKTVSVVPENSLIIKYDIDSSGGPFRHDAGLDVYLWYGDSLIKKNLDTCNKVGWEAYPGILPENITCDSFYYNLELLEGRIQIYRSDINSEQPSKNPYLHIEIPHNIKNIRYSEGDGMTISGFGVSTQIKP